MVLKLIAVLVPASAPALLFVGPRMRKAVATALVAGFVLAFPGAFVNPLATALIELVACESPAKLEVKSSGRGGGHFCVDARGGAERVFAWSALTSFDLHYVLVGVPASAFFLLRSRQARRGERG